MIQTTVHTWAFEPSHCKIGFSIRHFGITDTEGFFRTYQGTVTSEKEDFSDASVELLIDLNSIDTQDAQRDAHLKSADFFNTSQFPAMHFKSTSMEKHSNGFYQMTGGLTFLGVTHPVSLDVEFGGIVPKDPFGHTKAGFILEGKINRKDWGLSWNRSLDVGGFAVGDTVKIRCNIELIKQ